MHVNKVLRCAGSVLQQWQQLEETECFVKMFLECSGSGRALDSRLREPGFNSCAMVLNCGFSTLSSSLSE